MGTVISLDAWRDERARDDPAGRLERAVERLDALLRASPSDRRAQADVERELLAITGAVSIGMLEEAAERAERLQERLLARTSRGS
jgi:hypothetical protein